APGRGAEPQPQPRPAYYPPTTPGSTDGSPVSVAPVFSTQPPAAPDPVPAPPPPAAVPPAPEAPPAPAAGEALPVVEAPAAPLPAAPAGSDPVATQVLAIVAEKTGYPADMLELDLDLEADLGIDTVKQAETFAAIRERFDIPLQEGLNLRDYPTLAAVIQFVHEMSLDSVVTPFVAAPPTAAS